MLRAPGVADGGSSPVPVGPADPGAASTPRESPSVAGWRGSGRGWGQACRTREGGGTRRRGGPPVPNARGTPPNFASAFHDFSHQSFSFKCCDHRIPPPPGGSLEGGQGEGGWGGG